MGNHSPAALLNAIFFYNGKCFHLRGVQEHDQLKFGQIVWDRNPDCYTYYEHGSKNHSGGVNDDTDGKIVTILATTHPYSCHVVRPLFFQSSSTHHQARFPFLLETASIYTNWHQAMVLGRSLAKTKLQTLVKDMFRDAQRFTNHSLRATGATALFDTGVSEVVVQKCTGHKSINALHQYKRVTTTQNQLVANILQPEPEPTGDQFDFNYNKEDLDLFAQIVDPTEINTLS